MSQCFRLHPDSTVDTNISIFGIQVSRALKALKISEMENSDNY